MPTYHCDPAAGSNTAPYDTWAKAATSLQTICDLAVAGDVLYARGSQVLAAPIDIDVNGGTPAAGTPIWLIGCNAAGAEDGTRFLLDANGAAANCLSIAAKDGWAVRNFEFARATAAGVGMTNAANAVAWSFTNCYSHHNGGVGWGRAAGSFKYWQMATWLRCLAESNGGIGFNSIYYSMLVACVSKLNTGGYAVNQGCACWGCLAHANVGPGWSLGFNGNGLFGCVSDGNTGASGDGLSLADGPNIAIGCSFTTNDRYGIAAATGLLLGAHNRCLGNGTAPTNGTVIDMTVDGVDTLLTAGVAGYQDQAADKFHSVPGATGARVTLAMPDGLAQLQFPIGLPCMLGRPIGDFHA